MEIVLVLYFSFNRVGHGLGECLSRKPVFVVFDDAGFVFQNTFEDCLVFGAECLFDCVAAQKIGFYAVFAHRQMNK